MPANPTLKDTLMSDTTEADKIIRQLRDAAYAVIVKGDKSMDGSAMYFAASGAADAYLSRAKARQSSGNPGDVDGQAGHVPTPHEPLTGEQLTDLAHYLVGRGVGLSARMIAAAAMQAGIAPRDRPHDAGDRGRCIKLLRACPWTWPALNTLAASDTGWREQAALIRAEYGPDAPPAPAEREAAKPRQAEATCKESLTVAGACISTDYTGKCWACGRQGFTRDPNDDGTVPADPAPAQPDSDQPAGDAGEKPADWSKITTPKGRVVTLVNSLEDPTDPSCRAYCGEMIAAIASDGDVGRAMFDVSYYRDATIWQPNAWPLPPGTVERLDAYFDSLSPSPPASKEAAERVPGAWSGSTTRGVANGGLTLAGVDRGQ